MTQSYVYIWAFTVRPEHLETFRRYYGDGGEWTQLFRRARGYISTQLLQDETDPLRFVTIDTWSNAADYEAFRTAYAAEYAALDRLCEGLTIEETSIGHFVNAREP